MSKQPLLSIIVPVYNSEKWLRRCVESVLSQSFSDYELILVDDGSSDESGEICDRYSNIDNRIQVIHTKNSGVSSARNTGIESAKGQWISFIDSDDWISPGYLEKFNLVDDSIDICYQGIQYVYENDVEEVLFSYRDLIIDVNNIALNNDESIRSLFNGCPVAKSFKTAILKKYNIRFNTDLEMHEDHVFTLDYLMHIRNKILCVSNVGYNYRRGSNESLSSRIHIPEKLFYASNLLITRVNAIFKHWGLKKNDQYNELLTHYGYSQRLRAILNMYFFNLSYPARIKLIQSEKKNKEIISFYKSNFRSSTISRKIFVWFFCNFPTDLIDITLWTATSLKKLLSLK